MFFSYLAQFPEILTATNIVTLIGSTILGILFGALPGLGATLGVALLTSVTYGLDTGMAMIALLGIYVGAIYGGCHSAILINIPGTGAAAATALEGYPLSRQGKGGEAIVTATISSVIGTLAGVFAMLTMIPVLTDMALSFTSAEFFLLALFGVLICGSLTSPDSPAKGWAAGFLGLLIATVGIDPLQGYYRFTFGISELYGGIEVIPVILGGFAMPQIVRSLRSSDIRFMAGTIGSLKPRFDIIRKKVGVIIRSGLIGVGVGAVPGVGEDVAAWLSYDVAKKCSKEPETYGHGQMEGLIASEAANNACIGGALIPLLTLGVPGSPPAAMLLGAIWLHNVRPGPMLTFEFPDFIPMMSAILTCASLMLLVCGLLMARVSVYVLRIPVSLLMPVVAFLSIMGSYSLGFNIFNVYLMFFLGLIAYFMEEMGYPIAPLVIGMILGPMADANLRRALLGSGGTFEPFYTRPIAVVLLVLIILSLLMQTGIFRKLEELWKGRSKPAA